MGPVSGLLWLAGAAVAAVGWFLPGAPHEHVALFWGLVGLTVAYSVGCITRAIPWHRSGLAGHAVAVVSLQPLLVAALWLTGGADSYLGPVLVLPMLYVAYFFPARYAWPLAAIEIATYASPAITSGGGHLLGARTLGYAVAYVGLVLTIQFLKQRLVRAESQQRQMANQDPLTGLANRRAFDTALSAALAEGTTEGTRFTLLLADIDAFKQINDRFGHTTGDRVLREVAAHTSDEVRRGDCLARIGGDELALVAPGAGAQAARRLAEALREAAARVDTGGGPVSLTVSWAVYPEDGTDRFTLMRSLDRGLHAGKSERRAALQE
jgi:diguanylate cyclase (GGDEF)-like protein